jgi:hypothetical protein
MRHPYLCLGGLVGVAVVLGPLQTTSVEARPGAPSAAAAASDRPPAYTLRLSEKQVMARFIPEVRARPDLRDRALNLWRARFAVQASAIRQRFQQEQDWRPAFADAAALVDDFLEASLLPRAGEFPAGEGEVWVESIDPASGQRVRARQPQRRRPTLIAPQEGGDGDKRPGDKSGRVRGSSKPVRR